jgi:hypothetical protein
LQTPPSRNVSLTVQHQRFIEALVESGRYHTASEVVRAGLRLLEQLEAPNLPAPVGSAGIGTTRKRSQGSRKQTPR